MGLSNPFDFGTVISFVAVVTVYFILREYIFYDYWKKRGVPYLRPKYPFFGNVFEILFSLRPTNEIQQDEYNMFPNDPFYGTFMFNKPALVIKDPELIETVLKRDFGHFANRSNDHQQNSNYLSSHLLNLTGEKWKYLRNRLSPTFTTAKLRGMHEHVVKCTDALLDYMSRYGNGEPFELKELMTGYTTDVIISCAFGLDAMSLTDSDSIFRRIGRTAFKPSAATKLRFTLRTQFPRLIGLLGWKGTTKAMDQFFEGAVTETLKYREANMLERHDFLHLMNEVYRRDLELIENGRLDPSSTKVFTKRHLVSNAFVFFLAGSDSTASTLSSLLYELVLNQDVQEKLYREICDFKQKYGGSITFEAVREMKYLRQVFDETLRHRVPGVTLERFVTKEYRLPGTDLVLPVGMQVTVPLFALHHDPKYFPNPNQFSPERFDEGGPTFSKNGTYLPFGDGPRGCIAIRFAKYIVKFAVCMVLNKYVLKKCPQTVDYPRYDRRAFLLTAEGGLWVSLERRSN